MTIAFGLDLAGYSTGKSALAMAQRDEQRIVVTVFSTPPFSTRIRRRDLLAQIVEKERECIQQCCELGSLYADIPIDMQGLPYPDDVRYVWQLTHRPIDYAYGAMPAFADRIGAPTACFLNILRGLPANWLGTRIFETYPAMTLQKLNISSRGYKGGSCTFQAGIWQGDVVSNIAGTLRFTAEEGCRLDDDEFDSVICALTGVADPGQQLYGEALNQDIRRVIYIKQGVEETFTAPESYVLLSSLPEQQIYVQKRSFAELDRVIT